MDESGNKGLAYNRRIRTKEGDITPEEVARRVAFNERMRRRGTIDVTGYDTGLPKDDIESALREHFGSCGEIENVSILERMLAFITISGEDALVKAVELNGSHVRGRKIRVESYATQPSASIRRPPPTGRLPCGVPYPVRFKYWTPRITRMKK